MRSTRPEIRNPVLMLPAARGIMALPIEQRRPLALLLRQLAADADQRAHDCWRRRKGFVAAYWRVVCTYCKHIARTLDPKPGRKEN